MPALSHPLAIALNAMAAEASRLAALRHYAHGRAEISLTDLPGEGCER
jgi:hypothetical protein